MNKLRSLTSGLNIQNQIENVPLEHLSSEKIINGYMRRNNTTLDTLESNELSDDDTDIIRQAHS